MTTTDRWIHDLARVRPGDPIEVWDEQHLRHAGTVSQVASHLDVLWVRETSSGLPKLVPTEGHRLRHASAAHAA
ncbi:MAG TPA: hypothetical protein VK903_07940 [Propionicimonas sp.]|nr:hypothetical protein [Propionicimonas sp.]